MTDELKSKSFIERLLHGAFETGVALKAFNGIWEAISGSFILLLGKESIRHFLIFIVRGELLEDPHDVPLNFALHLFNRIPESARIFAAVYILIHGILNMFLAYQLYRERLWAYKVTIGFMIAFVIYQIHRIQLYHSSILFYVTLIDIGFILLTWHEYGHHKINVAKSTI